MTRGCHMTQHRVDRYIATFHAPPRSVPARDYYDGPLLGNGDLGVVIGGSRKSSNSGFPSATSGVRMPRYPLFTPVNIGWLEVSIPALAGRGILRRADSRDRRSAADVHHGGQRGHDQVLDARDRKRPSAGAFLHR